jgi:hypothetical protein
MRWLSIISLCFLLSACYDYVERPKQFGVLTMIKYSKVPKFDFDGHHSGHYKTEMCTPNRQLCVAGRSLRLTEAPSDDTPIMMVSIDVPLDGQKLPDKATYFFNVKTGEEIKCPDCLVNGESGSSGDWMHHESIFVAYARSTGNTVRVPVIRFSKGLANETLVSYVVPNSESQPSGSMRNYISLDTTKAAWYECYPECTLYWMEGDFSKVQSRETHCRTNYILPYWHKRGVVIAENSSGRNTKQRCRDEHGKPMYPLVFGERPAENYLVPDDDGSFVDFEWQLAK